MLEEEHVPLGLRNWLVTLRDLSGDNDYVLASGSQWIYGTNDHGDVGFYLRPTFHPLKGVQVFPLKLARRMQEFTGGQLLSVQMYLQQVIDRIDSLKNKT